MLRDHKISDAEINKVIDTFTKEVENTDPKIQKRAVQALLQEISIFPQKRQSLEKII
jgi:hypothetical protein